jgi:hypothetical protein
MAIAPHPKFAFMPQNDTIGQCPKLTSGDLYIAIAPLTPDGLL